VGIIRRKRNTATPDRSKRRKKGMSPGMRKRWMRNCLAFTAVFISIIVVVFFAIMSNYYYSTVRNGIEAKAKTAVDFFANYITKTSAEFYDSAYKYAETFDDSGKILLQFIDTDGRIIVSTTAVVAGSTPGTSDVAEAISTGKIVPWNGTSVNGEHIMSVSAPIKYSDGTVIGVMRYVTSMKLVDRQIFISVAISIGVGIVFMALIAIMCLVVIRSIIEPVGEITGAAKRIAEGSYGIQIEKNYADEMGEMVSSINEMSLKIAQSEKIQTEFISSVSHELRTPLTAITGWSETLIYNDQLDSETRNGIGIILKEARRLTKMVEELLEFTRIEDGRFTLKIEQIDIVAELEDSIFTYRELLKQDEMELEYEPYMDELPLIPGDPNRLKQVFLNLFDNAAKYGHDGKRISVAVKNEGEYVAITVRDYGPGIPEDEIEHVKKKFYKGSNAKERGSGIGLAVCDEIVKFHGGTFTLENAQDGGLKATVRLPMSSEIQAQ
jgi:signal transduction histidine kinase